MASLSLYGSKRSAEPASGEGIWTIDADGTIGYANPRMAEILKCPADQIAGRRLDDFLFPDDLAFERIRFQNRRVGVREQFDRRLRRADGSEVWVLACSSLYQSGKHQSGKSDSIMLTMMTDITERKAAEHALRQSERKYRELFENIREGVYQTSPDGRILAANPELLRMLGFPARKSSVSPVWCAILSSNPNSTKVCETGWNAMAAMRTWSFSCARATIASSQSEKTRAWCVMSMARSSTTKAR